MNKKRVEEIIDGMINAYVKNNESTTIVTGDEKLADVITFELKKKGVKMSYVIEDGEILMEIDPVWGKRFPYDSAADAMLKFREHMQYRMKYKCLTEILRFNICAEHLEYVDVLKKTFWYVKITKV